VSEPKSHKHPENIDHRAERKAERDGSKTSETAKDDAVIAGGNHQDVHDKELEYAETSSEVKKLRIDELFGPKDNSHIAKVFRGEVELTYPENYKPREEPIFWETMTMREDGTLVTCVKGQYKVEYYADDLDYLEILGRVKEQFPDLSIGKLCILSRYRDGRTEIETKDL